MPMCMAFWAVAQISNVMQDNGTTNFDGENLAQALPEQ